jgi:hypothetical protein
MDRPTIIQRLEGAVLFIVITIFYFVLDYSGWLYAGLLFAPDLSMAGYIANNSIGSHLYNIGHSMIVPLILLAVGIVNNQALLTAISLMWIAHIGLDRSLGFGLKFADSFHHTHLGTIGKPNHHQH